MIKLYKILNKSLLNKLDPRYFGRTHLFNGEYTLFGLAHTQNNGDIFHYLHY